MSEAEEIPPQEAPDHAPTWRRPLVLALLVLIAVSIGVRVARSGSGEDAKTQAESTRNGSGDGKSALTGDNILPEGDRPAGEPTEETPEAAEPKPEGLDALLPFLTEGGVAMLLGIGFGMATRAIFKLFMIGLLVLFAAVQYLSMKGILTVDWGAMGQWLNDFVLNVKERWGVAELIQYKLPSMGSFGLGFYLGLKRG